MPFAVTILPAAVRAQRPQKLPQIGILSFDPAAKIEPALERFRAGLRELGYAEGRNIHFVYRYAEGDNARLPGLAAELVARKVDVIVTYATGISAARQATDKIPIVQATGPDPVAAGFAASLAHPGGNVTGSSFFVSELMVKRLARALESGAWEAEHGHLREQHELDGALRLVVSEPA